MFVGIWMLILMWFTIYWGLRMVCNEYHARAISTVIYIGIAVAALSMIVGLLLVAVTSAPSSRYFQNLCMDFTIWNWYKAHFMGPDDSFVWYILSAYAFFVQVIWWYLDIFFHHFKFVFIFSHGLGFYIMTVVYRFAFNWNVNGVVGDNHFGIKRDSDGPHLR